MSGNMVPVLFGLQDIHGQTPKPASGYRVVSHTTIAYGVSHIWIRVIIENQASLCGKKE
jgi:hypothetical protein